MTADSLSAFIKANRIEIGYQLYPDGWRSRDLVRLIVEGAKEHGENFELRITFEGRRRGQRIRPWVGAPQGTVVSRDASTFTLSLEPLPLLRWLLPFERQFGFRAPVSMNFEGAVAVVPKAASVAA